MGGQGLVRRRVVVTGIVQGVGFRPYVYGLADRLALDGWVANDDNGVVLEVQGPPAAVAAFVDDLPREAPPLATIDDVIVTSVAVQPAEGFRIATSHRTGSGLAVVAPDVAPCDRCLAEIADPRQRRHRYAFTNCTDCGPRYSIVTGIPYDRPNTTMASFLLCPDCRSEYEDPTDRRFHAQPVCCPVCGPSLSMPLDDAADRLRRGDIVAVKGLGGYHLAVSASDEQGVSALRSRKRRADKPFAVLVADLVQARELCRLTGPEATLLASTARPIVLLPRRPDARVARAVAPGTGELGLMLPPTPLHSLLIEAVGAPLVCTSGNLTDEPIAYRDDDASSRLGSIADSFLRHDRPIRTRVDDSVYRVIAGAPYPIRRSRGYAPAPVVLPWSAPRPVLALGADLKNTVALHRGQQVFVSQHIGDLDDYATHEAFVDTISHLTTLLEIEPAIVAHDLHPDYRSSHLAAELDGVDRLAVQHHHAHIAACLADADREGPVIGVAFDGLGFGDDGTIWGGEFLIADLLGYERVGHLDPVPQPGGDQAARQPWRMAASYLEHLGEAAADDLAVVGRADHWHDVVAMARSGLRAPPTSSAGRLFDAVAALLGVRDDVTYEGQAAIELEQLAASAWPPARLDAGRDHPPIEEEDGVVVVSGAALVAVVVDDLRRGLPPDVIAARFHRGLADAVVAVCSALRDRSGLSTVALSGGVFLNRLLLTAVIEGLQQRGFEVLRHRRVPCNDGGISLGQAAVAAARDRAGLL